MFRQILVVTLQRIALWETVDEVDLFDAHWRFSSLFMWGFFWPDADFGCVYIQSTTYCLLDKSVCTASIVRGFENTHIL